MQSSGFVGSGFKYLPFQTDVIAWINYQFESMVCWNGGWSVNSRHQDAIGREIAEAINLDVDGDGLPDSGYYAEPFVDILFNSKVRIRPVSDVAPAFKVTASIGGLGEVEISGTPEQDFTQILDNTRWTRAAFEVQSVSSSEVWTLKIGLPDALRDADLTANSGNEDGIVQESELLDLYDVSDAAGTALTGDGILDVIGDSLPSAIADADLTENSGNHRDFPKPAPCRTFPQRFV